MRGEILRQLELYMGQESAQGVQSILKSAHQSGVRYIAAFTSIVALIFAATGVVVELKKALNHIWNVDTNTGSGLRNFTRRYVASIAFILGLGFLLMVSLILTTALSTVGKYMGGILPFGEAVLQWLNFGLSFAVITLLFAFMFKWLPDRKILWRDVWISAVLTAVLFNVGKTVIGAYIGTQAFSSTYGAVGGFLAMLIWMYYSSQILLFGATFSAIYAKGPQGVPSEDTATTHQRMASQSPPVLAPSPVIILKADGDPVDLASRPALDLGHKSSIKKYNHIGRWVFGAVILFLIAARIALPYVVKSYLNKQLDQMTTYTGHIDDVGISLWRGAYRIEGVKIAKRADASTPLFAAPSIEISLYWSRLLKLAIVGRIEMTRPEVNFVDSKTPEKRQTGTEESWESVLSGFAPIRIDYFDATDGKVHFRNMDVSPAIDVFLSAVKIDATNLTNSLKISKSKVAEIQMSARAMGQADVNAHVALDPLSVKPEFDLQLKLVNLNLIKLSPFMREYTSVDFEKGFLDLVTELAVHKQILSGYVKPIVRDFKILDWEKDKEKGALKVLGESAIAAAMQVFKNQKKDQFATSIPIEGSLEDKQTDIWTITKNIFKNAFVKAFSPKFDSVDKNKKGSST